MKFRDLWKSALAVLATAGTVLPGSLVTAEDTVATARSSQQTARKTQQTAKKAAPIISDVTLGKKGELTGFILDGQGKAVAKSKVVVSFGRKVVAETTTSETGQFRVSGLRGGIYQIAHADGVAVFRVWKNGTAPKSARQNALVVVGTRQVRGQDGIGPLSMVEPATLAATVAGVAGIVVGSIAISQSDDVRYVESPPPDAGRPAATSS
jgi:hypothetical protein